MNLIGERLCLHDGPEDDSYYRIIVDLPDGQQSFSLSKLSQLTADELTFAVHLFPDSGIHKGFGNRLQTQEGLSVYRYQTEKYDVIVSTGEKQPMRYMTFLEGVFARETVADAFTAIRCYELTTEYLPEHIGVEQSSITRSNRPYQEMSSLAYKRVLTEQDLQGLILTLDERAILTDVVQPIFLRLAGIYISPKLKNLLSDYQLSANCFPVTFSFKGKLLDYYFLNILAPTADINYAGSSFQIYEVDRRILKDTVTIESEEDYQQQRQALAHKDVLSTLRPNKLVFERPLDLFHMMGTIKDIVSEDLAHALKQHKMSGIRLQPNPLSCFAMGQPKT